MMRMMRRRRTRRRSIRMTRRRWRRRKSTYIVLPLMLPVLLLLQLLQLLLLLLLLLLLVVLLLLLPLLLLLLLLLLQVTNHLTMEMFVDRLSDALLRISGKCGGLKASSRDGYSHLFILRKAVLGEVSRNPEGIDWEAVSMPLLKKFCPDRRDELQSVPASMTAAGLSKLVLGRPDWAVYISMFACLFGEVASRRSADMDDIRAACSRLSTGAESYRRRHNGVTPHPMNVFDELVPPKAHKVSAIAPTKRKRCS